MIDQLEFNKKLDTIDKTIDDTLGKFYTQSFKSHLNSNFFEKNRLEFTLTKNTIKILLSLNSLKQNDSSLKDIFPTDRIYEHLEIIYENINRINAIYDDNTPNSDNRLCDFMSQVIEAKNNFDKFLFPAMNKIFFKYEQRIAESMKEKDELFFDIKNISSQVYRLENKLKELDSNTFKAGLAISFDDRVEKMKKVIIYWLVAAILSILLIPISLIVIEYFWPFNANSIAISLSIRTPLVCALFWIAWISSKKYSYLSYIRDDYMYKYDLAMAYQGYSAEVKKLPNSDDLLTLLLGGVIQNISQSPLDKVKSEPHTPWAETISPIIEKMGKDKDDTK